MVFDGEETFSYSVNDVWAALHDSDLLTRTVPGCKSMKPIGTNEYSVALSLGVAAVKGEYEGKVKVFDLKTPTHYMVKGEGAGAPGFVKTTVNCHLEPRDTGTLLKWHCDAVVGGMIASIGGKALAGIAKFMAKQFFTAFKAEMAGRAANQTGTAQVVSPRDAAASGRSATKIAGPSWFARLWNSIWLRFSRP